ncbi:MAG TPA: TIGR02757 family protein [Rectinemataceae bacterium]
MARTLACRKSRSSEASASEAGSFDPAIASFLEEIYADCAGSGRLCRDPLALVVPYADIADREVVGLVCSTLAFGSVDLIMDACSRALSPLGSHPASSILSMSDTDIEEAWAGFQYRYCFPRDIQALMRSIRGALRANGSLERLFAAGDGAEGASTLLETVAPRAERSIIPALSAFSRALRSLGSRSGGDGRLGSIRPNLLPDPAQGSACKRLLLYLRWMVRTDAIDPGGWKSLSPERLLVPLDTHMAATCSSRLGFLPPARSGRQPNLKDSIAVTARFAIYSPDDPVKYDFALTRPGIDPRPGDEAYGCL